MLSRKHDPERSGESYLGCHEHEAVRGEPDDPGGEREQSDNDQSIPNSAATGYPPTQRGHALLRTRVDRPQRRGKICSQASKVALRQIRGARDGTRVGLHGERTERAAGLVQRLESIDDRLGSFLITLECLWERLEFAS